MKRVIAGIAAVTLGIFFTHGLTAAEADKDFTCTAVKKDKAAKIDGAVDKAGYSGKPLSMKQTPERDKIQGAPATGKVFHAGQTLFVTVTVPIKADTAVSKGETWGSSDGAEVCLRDASGAQPGPTFIVHGYASGKHECTTDAGAPGDAVEKLEKAVKFAAKVGKNSWTAEWAIPLSAVGVQYKAGTKLGFNLGAWRSETSEWIVWRGAQGATYQLENAGMLTLE